MFFNYNPLSVPSFRFPRSAAAGLTDEEEEEDEGEEEGYPQPTPGRVHDVAEGAAEVQVRREPAPLSFISAGGINILRRSAANEDSSRFADSSRRQRQQCPAV